MLLIVESKALLVGEGADLKTLRAIRAIADAEPGVALAGAPLTMYFGPDNVLLTMDIRFKPATTRRHIEEAMESIEAQVRARFRRSRKSISKLKACWPVGRSKISRLNRLPLPSKPPDNGVWT